MSGAPAPTPPPPPGPRWVPGGIRDLVRDILGMNRQALAILLTVPLSMTALEYYGLPWHFTRDAPRYTHITGRQPPVFSEWLTGIQLPGPSTLAPYLWWGLACLVLLILLPMLVGAATGLSPRQLGLKLKGTGKDAWTYLVLFVIFFPVVWWISRTPDFLATYPFYPRGTAPLGWDFVAFEAVYCLQFLGIEFFFRGFMVLGLKPHIGMASVLVMITPYCMVHFYKPFPEAMGAIGAGLVLGVLAWRTGTVIYGWFLHYAVALGMDLLALSHHGRI